MPGFETGQDVRQLVKGRAGDLNRIAFAERTNLDERMGLVWPATVLPRVGLSLGLPPWC